MVDLFTMKGRFNRAKYIWSNLLISTLLFVFYGLIIETKGISQVLFVILFIISLYINFCFMAKRFHDFGKSGKNIIGLFIPLYGFFLSALLMFRKGQEGTNKYGKNPLEKMNVN